MGDVEILKRVKKNNRHRSKLPHRPSWKCWCVFCMVMRNNIKGSRNKKFSYKGSTVESGLE